MPAIRVASAALLSAGALALSAPPAVAGDGHGITPFGFRVVPSTVAAGGQVSLQLNRDGGCRGTATVTSSVFDTVRLPPGQDSATTVIDWDARPGAAYRVTFSCDGSSGWTQLTIAQDGGTARPMPLRPAQHGVEAGAGGSIGGFDLKEIGLGAVLIAGSLGVAYRRTRRRTGNEGA